MALIDPEKRELAIKVVYYGAALSGKTANLQQLSRLLDPRVRGRLMTLDTQDDRTLFFDQLPVFFRTASGVRVKVKLFTVPGHVMHESTRRIVLQGADGVVFVVDARRSEAEATRAYWQSLHENLSANGLDAARLPMVLQLNKRDLPDARGPDDLGDLAGAAQLPRLPAVAERGEGVLETLRELLARVYRRLDAEHGLAARFDVSEAELLRQLVAAPEPVPVAEVAR